jgi:hypothetical protein
MREVRDLDVGEMRLIRVGTFDQAVDSLEAA